MRFGKTAVTLTAMSALTGGCSSEPKPPLPAPITTAISKSALAFIRHPGPHDQMVASTCNNNPDSWVSKIDDKLQTAQPRNDDVETIGLAAKWEPDLRPTFAAGATIRRLGSSTYQLATSDDKPGENEVIDLSKGPYARELHGEAGRYDAVLSGRAADDGRFYFEVNCLPYFSFGGKDLPIPLSPSPTSPTYSA